MKKVCLSLALLTASISSFSALAMDIEFEKPIEVELPDEFDPPEVTPEHPYVFTFDFSNAQVDPMRILDGGIFPDAIPTLDTPNYVKVGEAEKINDDEYVVGAVINGEARAYPLSIMNWHIAINDILGGEPVLVTWDPLSGAAQVIHRYIKGQILSFGTSGMVYQSGTVLYDRQTQSLWSPLDFKAITGFMAPSKMRTYPVFMTLWKEFKKEFPNATVLTRKTGYPRDYNTNPYGDYGRNKKLLFPVVYNDASMARKEPMLGIRLKRGNKEISVAFPINGLLEWPAGKLDFNFSTGKFKTDIPIPMRLEHTKPHGRFIVKAPQDVEVDVTYSYFFAWSAHNPDSLIIRELP